MEGYTTTKDARDLTVSIFERISQKRSCQISVRNLYQQVISPLFKERTENYRRHKAAGDDAGAQAIKSALPAFSPATIFHPDGGHNRNNIAAYTGIAMLDFDHFPSEAALHTAAERARGDQHVLMTYSSVSGQGLHLYVPIELEAQAPAESYAEYYNYLCDYFSKLLGHEADRQCKDVTRLSFINYDPDAYLSMNATAFTLRDLERVRQERALEAARRGRPTKPRDADRCAEQTERSLHNKSLYFAPGHHNQFLASFAYQMNRFGVEEVETAQWLTAHYGGQAKDYGAKEIAQICRSAYANARGEFRSVLPRYMKKNPLQDDDSAPKERKQVGRKRDERPRLATREDVFHAVERFADVRNNDFKKLIEVRLHDDALPLGGEQEDARRRLMYSPLPHDDGFRPLNDELLNTLAILLEPLDAKITPRRIAEALVSHLPKKYNPLIDYYNSLPEWDGRDRVAELYAVFKLKYVDRDPQLNALLCSVMHRLLVGMVAGSLCRGYNELIWGLFGPEAYGKTRFFQNLLPEEIRELSAEIHKSALADKDTRISMHENILLRIDECSGMGSEMHLIINDYATMDRIDERRPYMTCKEKLPRCNTWVATGNAPDIVRLASGSRRWLIFHLDGKIDEERLGAIDKAQLFAQLLYEVLHDYPRFLTTEEAHRLSDYNIRCCQVMEKKLLLEHFYPLRAGDSGEGEEMTPDWYTASQIFLIINPRNAFRLDLPLLEEVLRVLDVETAEDAMGITLYHLVERPAPGRRRR